MLIYENIDEQQKPKVTDSFYVRYIVAVVAAWAAEAVTYPFDLTKTRLQVQTEIASAKHGFKMEHRGMIKTALFVAQNEGVHKLWSGMMAMWQRHIIYSGCRVVFYERLRNVFKDEAGNISIIGATVCGMTAGGLAQAIASPTDLVKIQMQCEGRRVLQGKPRRFNGSIAAYKMIYNESGILGFWRGVIPNAQRAALSTVGTVAGYDYSKHLLMKKFRMPENAVLHACAAFISGFISASLSTPADVIKTRMMNQPTGKDGRGTIYKGYMDCVHQTIKNEGVLSLYKGFVPVWMRLAPWSLVNWLVFENIMIAIGYKTF